MAKEKSKAKANAWKAFSLYIRNRDNWTCFVCDAALDKYHADAGHLFSRYWAGTLFDEFNVNCQCKKCNLMHTIDTEPYKQKWIQTWSEDEYWELYRKSKDLVKRSTQDYLDIEAYYKRKLEDINCANGFH